jgi:uncharacterized protein (DUF58 family)
MDAGETISLIAVVVLMIVVLGMAFSAYERRLKFKERKLEFEAGRSTADAGGAGEIVARLEKRVRVLERLATDRGPDVAAQIEALRDDRALAQMSETGETVK